jgi:hypothetical protein
MDVEALKGTLREDALCRAAVGEWFLGRDTIGSSGHELRPRSSFRFTSRGRTARLPWASTAAGAATRAVPPGAGLTMTETGSSATPHRVVAGSGAPSCWDTER